MIVQNKFVTNHFEIIYDTLTHSALQVTTALNQTYLHMFRKPH